MSGGGGTDGGGAGTKFCNPRLTGSEDTCGMTRILSFSKRKIRLTMQSGSFPGDCYKNIARKGYVGKIHVKEDVSTGLCQANSCLLSR